MAVATCRVPRLAGLPQKLAHLPLRHLVATATYRVHGLAGLPQRLAYFPLARTNSACYRCVVLGLPCLPWRLARLPRAQTRSTCHQHDPANPFVPNAVDVLFAEHCGEVSIS